MAMDGEVQVREWKGRSQEGGCRALCRGVFFGYGELACINLLHEYTHLKTYDTTFPWISIRSTLSKLTVI